MTFRDFCQEEEEEKEQGLTWNRPPPFGENFRSPFCARKETQKKLLSRIVTQEANGYAQVRYFSVNLSMK